MAAAGAKAPPHRSVGHLLSTGAAYSYPGALTTVVNYGTIMGGTSEGVVVRAGGTITNASGATIASGQRTISFNDTAGTTVSFGTVVNSGTIESTGVTVGAGVFFGQGGILTNHAGGLITA